MTMARSKHDLEDSGRDQDKYLVGQHDEQQLRVESKLRLSQPTSRLFLAAFCFSLSRQQTAC